MKDDIQWRNIDLNLLVTFSYLYRYRSVSLAAEKSFVSQSAMSHSLSRLRVLFDDPLFERKGHKMAPTEHAHHIAPTVHHLLDSIAKDLLTKSEFQPENYEGVCRIGLTDYAEFIFAPLLYDEIRKRAPQAQISFVNVNRSNYMAVTEHDKLDVIIGSMPTLDDNFQSQYLYTEEHVCLCDKRVLKGELELSVDAFASIEQALVSPDGRLSTQVDKKLAEHGLSRRVTVASGNFLTIRHLLKQRDLIAIVPEKMAQAEGFSDDLVSVLPPIAVAGFDIAMLWHTSRNNEDKGIWLRQLVAELILGN
ncbi:LysR family transcriptional regulator [Vibrio sp. AND4]|uniref:LysR family transcriptional regulator n=1 Tax=Vibrio sp. AND4 TaxID=314289 RepID=UPI00015F044C|nr:LysR family transcriptional regulator [Vibrio sp. AND4]EDP58684.1 putative LysR-like regular protein [Vibrio sp. AND4]